MSEERDHRDQIAQRLEATEERFRIAQVAGGIGWFEWDLSTGEWEWTPHVAVLFGPTSAVLSKAVAEIGGIAGGATGHAKLWC